MDVKIVYAVRVPGRKSARDGQRKNTFGLRLKSLRLEKGISLRHFAAKLERRGWEVSEDVWLRIESGKRLLSDTELVLALKVLGCKLRDLE